MRIVIADDHPVARWGIKSLLLATDARVVGETGDGREALRLVEETRPDLVILDRNLVGEVDGAEVCRRVKALGPEPPRVLIYTDRDSAGEVSPCLSSGADGCLHKSAAGEELLDAIRRTVAGERVWELDDLTGTDARSQARRDPKSSRLTPREHEVAGLVLRRYSNARIAEELHLSLTTVKTHVSNILSKLGLESRWELFHLRIL